MDIEGKLTIHYETGMEGVAMAFEDNRKNLKNPYDSLYFLKKGHYWKVYEGDKIFWEGEITDKLAELYSDWNKTGYDNKKWIKMFRDEMCAKLDLREWKE